MRAARLALVLSAAACATGPRAAPLPPPRPDVASKPADAPSQPAAPVKPAAPVGPAWARDERWPARLREVATAQRLAIERALPATGLSFNAGREPVVEYDEKAAPAGEVGLRFVDGVRRPVIRLAPAALLTGAFRAESDVPPLVVAGAILVAAGDRPAPAWVVSGISIVAGGSFERRLAERALAGPAVRVRESELFSGGTNDPLAAAARATALARLARSERPFVRFLELVIAGRSEDVALSEMGIGQPAFLDAATDTERARAVRSFAEDALLPALRDARRALDAGDLARADAALAPFGGRFEEAGANAWLAADARLCLAQVAVLRREEKAARAALAAAMETRRVVRLRDARIVEASIALMSGSGAAALRTLAADDLEALFRPPLSELFAVPAVTRTKYPGIAADVFSTDATKRKSAAAQLGESNSKDAAPALRLLAGDADPPVRRAAIAALAAVLSRAADDDVEHATRDPDATVRRTALDLLAVSDRARATKRAAQMKDDPDASIRTRAAELSKTK